MAGFIFACKLSSKLPKVAYESSRNRGRSALFHPPRLILSRLLSNLAEGLSKLDLQGIHISDSLFEALSLAPAAKTLKFLNLSRTYISDASAHIWNRFISLEELWITYCWQLDVASFEAIAALTTLQTLRFYNGVDCRRLPSIFLRHDALPSLRSLSISMAHYPSIQVLTEVIELLQARPNRERLDLLNLMISTENIPEELVLMEQIHKLCPNLTDGILFDARTQPFDPELELVKSLPHLNNVNSGILFNIHSQHVPLLAECFPDLQYLSLSGLRAPITSNWEIFTNVRNLNVQSDEFNCIEHYPPRLERLSLSFLNAANASSSAVDNFYQHIADKLKHLKSLVLTLNIAAQKRHILLLLRSLTKLQRLQITYVSGPIAADGQLEPIEISHPNLRELPDLSRCGFLAVPLWLPRVDSLRKDIKEAFLQYVDPVRLPALSDISFRANPTIWPKIQERLHLYRNQIRELSILGDELEPLWTQLSSITSMKYLASLVVSESMPKDVAGTILSQLPLLSEFNATITSDSLDLSWLHHPQLSKLTVYLESAAPSGTHMIEISRESLPILNSFTLGLMTINEQDSVSLRLSDLDSLAAFIFRGGEGSKINLQIQNCSTIHDMTVSICSLSGLELVGLSGLMTLTLTNISIEENIHIGVIECPRIRNFFTHADSREQIACEKLKSLLEEQAVQRPDINFSLYFTTEY
jgi:hypothetical protein